MSNNTSIKNCYSDDDLHCFNNLQWEMGALQQYLQDCNLRKSALFKISLAGFSIVATGLVTIFGFFADHSNLVIESPFNIIFGLVLFSIGLVNIVIIKELVSIHASRLITFRQMNCIRQAMDSVRFKKHEGRYPNDWKELKQTDTKYWLTFGKHRKLPIENSGLKASESRFFRSPDKFMIFVITMLSLVLLLSPLILILATSVAGFYAGIYSGVISTLFIVIVWNEIRVSIKLLDTQLSN